MQLFLHVGSDQDFSMFLMGDGDGRVVIGGNTCSAAVTDNRVVDDLSIAAYNDHVAVGNCG